jgi:hypothetical protein
MTDTKPPADDVAHWLELLSDGKAVLSKSEMWDLATVLSRINGDLVRDFNTLLLDNSRHEDRTKAAEARLAEAVEVLKPFATALTKAEADWQTPDIVLDHARSELTLYEFGRARSVVGGR